MASASPKNRMTPSEFLQFERNSDVRHMYWQGEVFLMSGASRQHVKICGNLFFQIRKWLDDTDCEVMMSDMRVKNERTLSYMYPDVLATCESPRYEDDQFDTLLNPQVIIEVLSDSTETFDRGSKFQDYQRLLSVQEYVLVSQKKMMVERYTRKEEPTWEYWWTDKPDALLTLDSIGCQIALKDIYHKVEFPDSDEEENLKVVEQRAGYNVPG